MDDDEICAQFVDSNWAELVQRVGIAVMPIADELWSNKMLGSESYSKIKVAATNQEKMRVLGDVLHSGGNAVKSAFYSGLEKHAACLLRDLSITEYHLDSGQIQPSGINTVINQYKRQICTEYQHVMEYNSLPGEHVLLCQRYIEPLINNKYRDRKEREKEICSRGESFQDVLSSRSSNESVLNSLFDPDGRGITPGAVILQGNSGNGKSFAVQKIMLDWASGNLYRKEFEIVFHLKCKEINCILDTKSLVELLSWSCGLTSHQISLMLQKSPERVMFIIDGFDELRLTEEIYSMTPPTDPHQRCSPELTLCALLKRHVQSESFLLVTTRSTATDTLTKLLKTPYSFTEIMGFSEQGVEEYFQKFFQDKELFRKAYKFVKANEILLNACSIPVICWIICTVIRERFNDGADVTSGLETATSIYVDFVFTLLEHHCQGLSESVPTLLKSLGQLAESGMMKQQVMFDAQTVYGTMQNPACSPFLCKFLFKKRTRQETMFSFMHLSFQEFFTALYFVFVDDGQSMMKLTQLSSFKDRPDVYNHAPPRFADVMKFAFGLLNEDVQCTLGKHGLLVDKNTQAYLKKWFLYELDYSYAPLMFNYLYELHESSFVKEVMQDWDYIYAHGQHFRRADCWALVYCTQWSHSIGEIFDLYLGSQELSISLPVLRKVKDLRLTVTEPSDSDLTDLMCALTERQTLSSQSIDISWNVDDYVVRSLRLTLPCSEPIDGTKLFQTFPLMDLDALMSAIQSLSKLKMVELNVGYLNANLCVGALSISQNCPDLTKLRINADSILEDGIRILQSAHTRPNCTMTFKGYRCDQYVKLTVSCQGFSDEKLRKPLFRD
ncbi:NACHT, LRR and PYD domains-containing protein 1 homolog isoform X2 [Triplophysa dalaica]|uniref:NACHT, LRR and PYD domains-containing protein 1 homolog isoform X2 n=1 Tax=Triplophysa dalaica TaxID=1582913 RepID=UPI0024DFF8BC|nr:NACHT, LRR and PYD domains-containing protein 1 homolog isoform X2 [Triplophysa dalaica]